MSAEPHPRERLDRKALKGPDEFVVWTARATAWAQRNRSIVIAIAAAGVALLLGAALLGWQSARRQEAAAAAFRTATQAFAAGRFDEAATAFEIVATEHAGTSFGRLALLYRGHSAARQDKPADAAAAYQEYLAQGPQADYLQQLALTGLGRARELTGDVTGARESFERAAELPGPYRIDALLAVARLAESAGDGAAAEAAHKKVLDAEPDPETRALVTRKLPPAPPSAPAAAPVSNVR